MRLLILSAVTLLLAVPVQAQLASPSVAGVSFAHVHLNVANVEVHKRLWVDHFAVPTSSALGVVVSSVGTKTWVSRIRRGSHHHRSI